MKLNALLSLAQGTWRRCAARDSGLWVSWRATRRGGRLRKSRPLALCLGCALEAGDCVKHRHIFGCTVRLQASQTTIPTNPQAVAN